MSKPPRPTKLNVTAPLWVRLVVIAFLVAGIVLVVITNNVLNRRLTETQRADSRLTAALYSGNLVNLLERQALVPLLLARDPVFISALQSKDYTNTSRRLIEFVAEIRAASIDLLDVDGRVVASSERRSLGTNRSASGFVSAALRDSGTIFSVIGLNEGASRPEFQYARKVQSDGETIGIVVVYVDLRQLEDSWRRRRDNVVVTNSEDVVVLATNPFWRRNTLTNILASQPPPNGMIQALQPPRNSADDNPDVYLDNRHMLRAEVKTGFRGWRMTYFGTLDNVRARVFGTIALEIMILALMLAGGLYLFNKRLQRQSTMIARESTQLRQLNARLTQEIEERRKVERNLQVAEQSLEQSSKLAALGQMSAAVSHELNQPLAAMRTYLAGARLLLRRKRPDEALASFYRIDDLIERMGAITRQLKTFARKGTDDQPPMDLRDAVDGSLAMMTPQLSDGRIEIRKILPPRPVMVNADQVRLDQVIVNLLRNAIDAVEGEDDPMIEVLVSHGKQVTLTVRDNGMGIKDPEALFEPFYTTKKSGEGVGLGLAISAGIASELGGRLTAQNAERKGAIFELQLPRAQNRAYQAAE